MYDIVTYNMFKIEYVPDSLHFHNIDFLIHLISFLNAHAARV